MARISGKLTAKSLGWDRSTIGVAVKKVPADGGRVFIGRIVGNVAGLHETMDDQTGEVQTGLKGNFKGVSSLNEFVPKMDGESVVTDKAGVIVMVDTGKQITMTAGRCYLPSGIQDMIEGVYKEARQSDANATVSFGVDLYAIPSANKAGYSYDADTVTEAATSDPLDNLLAAAANIKALPSAIVKPSDEEVAAQAEATAKADAEAEAAKKVAAKAK
jgi:hypothetical protein